MLHSRAMFPQEPSRTPSPSMGVPFLSELHIDGIGMSKGECSGKRDPSAHLRQPLPGSRTVPALLTSHPPTGAHIPDKDKGSVTHHHLQLRFWHSPKHGSAQPSHTVPGSPQMLRGDHILGATGHPLQQGAHDHTAHPRSRDRGPVSVTGTDAATCLHLTTPSSYICPWGQERMSLLALGGRGRVSREGWDQGHDWRVLAGVMVPGNG